MTILALAMSVGYGSVSLSLLSHEDMPEVVGERGLCVRGRREMYCFVYSVRKKDESVKLYTYILHAKSVILVFLDIFKRFSLMNGRKL